MNKVVVASLLTLAVSAGGYQPLSELEAQRAPKAFQRVGTLANYRQHPATAADETVSEIVAATRDGMTLVYTDAVRGNVGVVDIADPTDPQPAGVIAIDSNPDDDVEYSPTSVDILGNRFALVAASTGESFTAPDGVLVVIDLTTRTIVTEIPLSGQPDSVKISPDERYAAIAIENERDEELCVGGTGGPDADEDECRAGGGVPGGLPQTPYGNPPGYLAVLTLNGAPNTWAVEAVSLTGLATYAPEDPEPEFVDINTRNEAVVTLQENNHIAIVDLATRAIVAHFPAGTVTLTGVDLQDDNIISLGETLADVPREPDSIAWLPTAFGDAVATANEGDLFGGSRGFSIFAKTGRLVFDAGSTFEHLAVQHGHYPEGRSDAKGTEPEAIAYGDFDGTDYLFVASERGGFIAVYTVNPGGQPRFEQLLPAPLEPEGVLPIPGRNLLIASGEADLEGLNVRSTIMIYALTPGVPTYPDLVSRTKRGTPIPWSAMSGLVAVPGSRDRLLGVWDSAYATSNVFRIDASQRPAVIADALSLVPSDGTSNYDPEGVAVSPDGLLWIASEGNASDSRPNLLLKVDEHGNVLEEIGLPAEILHCRRTSTTRGTLGSGFEGVAVIEDRPGSYRLVVAQQRGWDYTTTACEHLDDDDDGVNMRGEPNRTRLWIYDPAARAWGSVGWQLAALPPQAAWVGLSEITQAPGGDYVVIERDNRTGDFAALKTLVKFRLTDSSDGLVSLADKSVYDLMPHLLSTSGWITDKPEGLAITDTGETFAVTDNDGVDDWSGETWFFRLGRYWHLFE